MKRKFRMLMSFLSKLKKDKIEITLGSDESNINWYELEYQSSLPQNIKNLLMDITDSKVNEIFEMDCYSETEYYELTINIYPKEKKINYSINIQIQEDSPDTYEKKLEDPELEEYFTRTGTEFITANYSGSGDDGEINKFKIDGVDTDISYYSDDPDHILIWDTIYERLESAYGGWEIDEGSVGTIELNNNMEIAISHTWFNNVMELCDEIFEIREEDLEE